MASHTNTCDMTNGDSPSTTVAILRQRDDAVDYAVLGDSAILIEARGGELVVAHDDRTAYLPDHTNAGISRSRNTEGGFWIASNRPDAAEWAVTGTFPLAEVTRAAVMTDGITRLVERYDRSWVISSTASTSMVPPNLLPTSAMQSSRLRQERSGARSTTTSPRCSAGSDRTEPYQASASHPLISMTAHDTLLVTSCRCLLTLGQRRGHHHRGKGTLVLQKVRRAITLFVAAAGVAGTSFFGASPASAYSTSGPEVSHITQGHYYSISSDSGAGCIDDSAQYGVRLYPCNSSSIASGYQAWYAYYVGYDPISGVYGSAQLQNVKTGQCLDYSLRYGLRAYSCNSTSFLNGYQAWTVLYGQTTSGRYAEDLRVKAGDDSNYESLDYSSQYGLRCYIDNNQSFWNGYQAFHIYNLGT